MESAPTVLNRSPPPFPDTPRTVDFSALEFILGLIAVITIPALIYVFFFAVKCPPNPFRRSRRSSDSVPSGDDTATVDDKKEKEAVVDVKYRKEIHQKDVGGECPVCLSVFGDGDEVKLLSACKHSFHASCIDLWFNSHSNCPVCRASVALKRPDNRTSATTASVSAGGGRDVDRLQGLPDATNLV
ncbi:hypothetical protein FNV43_RR09983 [Rhamnella rubrinervis]|uniref:RING-type domain-containing protein n=1 Tax=Rhamnella rubrinervis TaxID=2594499 RepID=A0A8K0MKV9_9ROSA|nr:hypothetical protein FNV43_RR09983 [Rhamnella rubrinervis]